MQVNTMVFGGALFVLGIVGYLLSGAASFTALIPSVFGLVFSILGLLARKEKLRKHVMHVAVLLALLCIFATASSLVEMPKILGGEPHPRPAAVYSQSIMAVMSTVYFLLAINSFIQARMKRKES